MATTLFDVTTDRPAALAAGVAALVLAAALIGAWIFEYGFKILPCPLCLQQRWPYYLGIPLAAATWFAASRGVPRCVIAGGLALLAVLMLWSTGMGVYHAGAEWKFWPGPIDCGAPAGAPTDVTTMSLEELMRRTTVIRCDEAAWRFFGTLSLPGFNALISAGLLALVGLTMAGRSPLARFTR